jgi:hypothetical protein
MNREITIRALLQRQRRLHPFRGSAARDAALTGATRRHLKASNRAGVADAADRRATWRAAIDRLTTRPR